MDEVARPLRPKHTYRALEEGVQHSLFCYGCDRRKTKVRRKLSEGRYGQFEYMCLFSTCRFGHKYESINDCWVRAKDIEDELPNPQIRQKRNVTNTD